jgi:hypothetical protein
MVLNTSGCEHYDGSLLTIPWLPLHNGCAHVSLHVPQGLSKGVLEHLVGILIAAPRLLKHPSIAALLADPVNAMVSTPSNRSSIPGGGSAAGEGGAGVHKGPAVISGKALRASNDAAAHAAAAATLSAWQLAEGDAQEGRREGGQLLMMVVGDKNLQSSRRTLDSHVSSGTWL